MDISKQSIHFSLHRLSPDVKLLCRFMWRCHGFRWHLLEFLYRTLIPNMMKNHVKCLAADTTSRTDEWMWVPDHTFLFDVITNTRVDGCDCRLGYHRDWPLPLLRSHWVCPTMAPRGTINILTQYSARLRIPQILVWLCCPIGRIVRTSFSAAMNVLCSGKRTSYIYKLL